MHQINLNNSNNKKKIYSKWINKNKTNKKNNK